MLKKLLKHMNVGSNYFRGQEKKGTPVENKKQQVTTSLIMELMQNDQNHLQGVQAAQEQVSFLYQILSLEVFSFLNLFRRKR